MDISRIKADMNDPKFAALIKQDLADAKTLGVRKTPEFFVNGKPLPRFGLAHLKALVQAELAANYPR
jgi:protein-disulfide isomerase